MSAGGPRVRHLAWCPSLSNRYRTVPAGKGLVRHEPVGKVFDCLCKRGTIELRDPRPGVVAEAVARHRERTP